MAVIGNLAVAITATTAGLNTGLGRAGKMLGGFSGAIGRAAGMAGLLAPPLALAAGIMKTINAGTTFEKELSSLGALTGESGAALKGLEEQALKLGPAAGGASMIVEGMQELSKAGMTASQIMDAIKPTALLAAVDSTLSLADASEITASTLNQFQLQASQTAAVADALAFTANATQASIGGLGKELAYAGPTAHAAGMGLNETLAVMGKLSDLGMGDQAGTMLRSMIGDMSNPTAEAKKTMKELQLSFFDASGAMKPMAMIVDDLNQKLGGMSVEDKMSKLGTMFDKVPRTGLLGLMGAGGASISNLQGQIGGSDGYAQEQADARLNNTAGAWLKFQGTIETIAIKIWQPLQTGAAATINFISSTLSEWTPAFVAFGGVIGSYWSMLGEIGSAIVSFWSSVVGPGFSLTLADVVDGLIFAQYTFNNWGLAIDLAVASSLLQVVRFANNITYFFGTVIPTVLTWSVDNFGNLWATALDAVLTGFINFGQNIRTNMTAIWAFIKSGGVGDLALTWTPLMEGFKSSLSTMPEIAERAMGPIEAALNSQVETLGTQFGEGFAKFRDDKLAEASKANLPNDKPPGDGGLPKPSDFAGGSTMGDMKSPKSFLVDAAGIGSQAAEKSILNAIYGPTKSDSKEQLKVGREQLAESKKQTKAIEKLSDMTEPEVVAID